MLRGIIFAVVFILMALGSGQAANIYVPDDYPTIQGAINAAVDGDTVIVRPGTYVENVDFMGKAITVTSELGPVITTIDANSQGSAVKFISSEDGNSVLDGFRLVNGIGTLDGAFRFGGGIFCKGSSPRIVNNLISGNSSDGGGGIICRSGSSPVIMYNRLDGNTAADGGGGIGCDINANPVISSNRITGNTADAGGGIDCYDNSSPTITNNNITGNTAVSFGGGICCWDSTSPIITNNTIAGNTVDRGAGIYCYTSAAPSLMSNTIVGNTAIFHGGGICCNGAAPTITNTIFWNNSASTGKEMYIGYSVPSTVTISYSDVEGGQSAVFMWSGCTLNWGSGMIDANPLFAHSTNDDFHLTWDSPCKNTGDNSSVSIQVDFEGDPRIHDGTVDMGADEFHTHLYHTGTVTPGSPIQVKVIGDPGISPVTLALGSGVQDPPQSTPYGDLYLILPPVRTFNLGGIPSNGVLVYPATVPGFWPLGSQYPLQALLGPLGPGSVLTNLMTLTVE